MNYEQMARVHTAIWKVYKGKMLSGARKRAKATSKPFDLTQPELDELILKCGGRCSVSGLRFGVSGRSHGKNPWAPSLDRIDSQLGYTKSTCRIVCVAANLAMNEWGLEVLERLSIWVAARTRKAKRVKKRKPAAANESQPDSTSEVRP